MPNTVSAGMEQQLYKCLGPGVLVELAVSHRGWPARTPLLLLTCWAVWLISTARSDPEFPIPMTTTVSFVKA